MGPAGHTRWDGARSAPRLSPGRGDRMAGPGKDAMAGLQETAQITRAFRG